MMTGSDGRWVEEGRLFWQTTTRSQQRRYSENWGGTPAQGQTGDFPRCHWKVGAAAGAAADAAVGPAAGGSVVVLVQGL